MTILKAYALPPSLQTCGCFLLPILGDFYQAGPNHTNQNGGVTHLAEELCVMPHSVPKNNAFHHYPWPCCHWASHPQSQQTSATKLATFPVTTSLTCELQQIPQVQTQSVLVGRKDDIGQYTVHTILESSSRSST